MAPLVVVRAVSPKSFVHETEDATRRLSDTCTEDVANGGDSSTGDASPDSSPRFARLLKLCRILFSSV